MIALNPTYKELEMTSRIAVLALAPTAPRSLLMLLVLVTTWY